VTESLTEEPEVSALLTPNSVVGKNSDPTSPMSNPREKNMNAVIYNICHEDLEQLFMNYKHSVSPHFLQVYRSRNKSILHEGLYLLRAESRQTRKRGGTIYSASMYYMG
jgi:hypothetical protein